MKMKTLEAIKKNMELLDSKINTLTTVQTMLTTVLFSSADHRDQALNESIISMLKYEKELKSDIRKHIGNIQQKIKTRPAEAGKRFIPEYLRAIQGGKKDFGVY